MRKGRGRLVSSFQLGKSKTNRWARVSIVWISPGRLGKREISPPGVVSKNLERLIGLECTAPCFLCCGMIFFLTLAML